MSIMVVIGIGSIILVSTIVVVIAAVAVIGIAPFEAIIGRIRCTAAIHRRMVVAVAAVGGLPVLGAVAMR